MEVIYNNTAQRIPLKSWATDLDDGGMQQAINATNLPFADHHVALMPDSHMGYGVPIGIVLATKGYVVPNAIGVDIGCGMNARRTNIEVGRLRDAHPGQGTVLKAVLNQIDRNVPSGNGPNGQHKAPQASLLVESITGREAPMGLEVDDIRNAGSLQLGSLGGGNHFIELDADAEGFVWIMLHSGSRAVGYKVCEYFNHLAVDLNERYFSVVPKSHGLSFLPIDTQEGRDYLWWMRTAMDYARENREKMLDAAVEALFSVCKGITPDDEFFTTEAVDTHHNYGDMEHHFGQNVFVVRKGATRARRGEMLIIPGSMETGSYIARGLGNPEAFESAPHGAGRAMSRKKASDARTVEDMVLSLQQKDIELVTRHVSEVVDEAGHAYKDIDAVMKASEDLVEPVYKLRPLGVLKGSDIKRRKKK